jgi:hypothetical protein
MTKGTRAQALQISKPYASSYPGHSGYARVLHDYYREPARAVDQLLEKESFTGRVYDPFCGGGTVPARCRAHGIDADGSDLQDIAGCTVRDAFTITERHDNFVSNPPYKPAEAAIRYLLPLARHKLAFLLRTNFLHSIRRRAFYASMPLVRVWFLSSRPSCPPGIYRGSRDDFGCLIQPEENGGKMDYSWFIFERGHTGPWTGGHLG